MLSITRLDSKSAKAIIAAALKKADEIGVQACVAVCDESGNLIAFERMDDAKTIPITIAIDKSFTAAGLKKATHELGETSQPGAPAYGLSSTLRGRVVVIAGGLPVVVDGSVVGGVGVSGGSPAQDLELAQAGLVALGAK